LAKDFVGHLPPIARIYAAFVRCPWPKSRRELVTFIGFRRLTGMGYGFKGQARPGHCHPTNFAPV
jgi:hypothetical protein